MGDKREAEVPKHKLTKEQLDFAKRFKSLMTIKYFLDSKALLLQNQMKDLRELYTKVGIGFQGLRPPKEPMRELEGMNFKDEGEGQPSKENLMLNY